MKRFLLFLALCTSLFGAAPNYPHSPTEGDKWPLDTENITATFNGTGWTSQAVEYGTIKLILDTESPELPWALTGINGIPLITSPDSDAKYVIKMAGTVKTPTFSPAAGIVTDGATITFLSNTAGVTFMATTNGTDPSRTVGTPGASMVISGNTTYEVMAYKNGVFLKDSAKATAVFTVGSGGGSGWIYSYLAGGVGLTAAPDSTNTYHQRITATATTTIDSVSVYQAFVNHDSGRTIKFAVYASDGTTLLGSGQYATTTNLTDVDVVATLAAPVSVTSGTHYIISWSYSSSSVGQFYYGSGGTSNTFKQDATAGYGTFPNAPGSLNSDFKLRVGMNQL